MMSDSFFRELADATTKLRHVFMRHGLKPPTAVIIEDHDTGDRMRHLIPHGLLVVEPRMTERPEWIVTIVGIEYRYPGQWFSKRKGHRELV